MKYAYFPGCSAESTARDQYLSTLAVARALGIELVEPEGWTCCGSTPAHQANRAWRCPLRPRILLKVRDMGLDMVVSCAACYSRMKMANHEISNNPAVRGSVSPMRSARITTARSGCGILSKCSLKTWDLKRFKKRCQASLDGLKVACYYGCLLVRPHEVTGFDDPENPVLHGQAGRRHGRREPGLAAQGRMLRRVSVAYEDGPGGEAFGFDHRHGEGFRRRLHRGRLPHVPDQSGYAAAGYHEEKPGRRYDMPVMYITQLMGLCLGIAGEDSGLNKLMVSPTESYEKASK